MERSSPGSRLWFVGGGILVLLQSCLALLSSRFEHGSDFLERPIVLATAVLYASGALYCLLAFQARTSLPSVKTVWVVALLARLPLLLSEPIQEDDIYRYIWDGRVAAAALDPYAFSPQDILDYEAGEGHVDPDRLAALARLVALKRSTPALGIVLERVNNPGYATIYPVAALSVFRIHGELVPPEWSPRAQVLSMKLLLSVFDIGLILAVMLLLSATGKPRGLSFLYAWCPLILKEFSNSGHMDAIPTLWVVLAVCAQVRGRAFLCGLALAVAVAAKFYALFLLPLALRSLGGRRALVALLSFGAATMFVLSMAPRGGGQHSLTVLDFAMSWENHDAVFSWVVELWKLLWRGAEELTFKVGDTQFFLGTVHALTLGTFFVVFSVVLLVAALRLHPRTSPSELPRYTFGVLAAFFLLGPLGFPWYFSWCVPFFPFVILRSWFVLPGLLMTYYLRFWLDYHYPQGENTEVWGFESGARFFDYVVVSLEFLLFYAVLAVEVWKRRRGGLSR